MYELDNIDRNILSQLVNNARITMEGLSGKVGLSKTPVITRIKRMEADGVIRGYSALIDHTKVGEGHISFVQVTLSDTRTSALEAFNAAVAGLRKLSSVI